MQMLFIISFVPETPRWLASHDRGDEPLLLQRLHQRRMSDESIRFLQAGIMQTVAVEKSIGTDKWSDLVKNDSLQSQRRFLIASSLSAAWRNQRDRLLLRYSFPKEHWLRPTHVCPHGWVPSSGSHDWAVGSSLWAGPGRLFPSACAVKPVRLGHSVDEAMVAYYLPRRHGWLPISAKFPVKVQLKLQVKSFGVQNLNS